MNEAAEVAKAKFNEALPMLKEAAIKAVEDKLEKEEKEQLAKLNSTLSDFKHKDLDGKDVPYVWLDFDSDKSGHLETLELMKVSGFITAELLKKVKNGEMTAEDAKGKGSNAALAIGALAAILLGKQVKDAFAKKKTPPVVPPPGPAV
jgi:hypothetical protein